MFYNPLKMKRVCFIQGLSMYRAVNTLHFGYKNHLLMFLRQKLLFVLRSVQNT
jgi:hypothetical protein